jgi:hypothetical protein
MNHLMSDRTLRQVTAANPVPTSTLTAEESARAEQLLQNLTAASRPALPETPKRWSTRSRAAVGGVVALLAAVGGGFLITAPASAEQVLLEAASNSDYQMAEGAICTSTDVETGASETYLCERDAWLEVQGMVTLEKLPTDPESLSEALTEQGELTVTPIGKPHELWTAATDLLRERATEPELRGALWETMAGVPGLTLEGQTTDALGREGTAVSADFSSQNQGRSVVVLDPSNGTLLETRQLDDDGAVQLTVTVVAQSPRD